MGFGTLFTRHKDILINFRIDGPISEEAFQEWLDELGVSGTRYFLSCAVGTVEMTSAQRKRAAEFANERGIRTIVITDDRIGRGIVTAVSWLGANIKAFSWNDLINATEAAGIKDPVEQKHVAQLARDLRKQAETRTA